MIGSILDQPGVGSAADEDLMKDISHRHPDALTELYGRHSKRLRATGSLFTKGRQAPRLDGYHRAPSRHRSIAPPPGLLSCEGALRETGNAGITKSAS